MKTYITIAGILFISSSFKVFKKTEFPSNLTSSFFQYDTSAKKIKEFKLFSKDFFDAIVRKDVVFLRSHIIFPIVNSSLSSMDTTLKENNKIDEKYFFKNFGRLFPKNVNKEIEKRGRFFASSSQSKFYVRIYSFEDNDENETNYTWFFVKKDGRFYFTQFKVEL
ncbi:MAG: hypothetical protein JST58_20620 [Bacteroidetes bacterium]|nr:hypothetical protein [Bacteroidota bacterium]